MDNKPNFSREVKLQWAGSRERNLASGRGGAFFLTSLFIERFDPKPRRPVNERYGDFATVEDLELINRSSGLGFLGAGVTGQSPKLLVLKERNKRGYDLQ